jgi:hypothetical protein
MRNPDFPAAAILIGSSAILLMITVLFVRALPSEQLTLVGHLLGPSALLWFGVYGILEHKRD